MNDATKKNQSFNDILVDLNRRTFKDPEFKKRYLENPKSVIEETLGVKLPDDFKVVVHENTPRTLNIALGLDPSSLNLTDEQLELVAGGGFASAIAAGIGTVGTALVAQIPGILSATAAIIDATRK